MPVRRAVYGGTFDPPTLGHLYVIAESARLFDEVVVAVGTHAGKDPLLPVERRVQLLEECSRELGRVRALSFAGRFLVDVAREVEAGWLVRGVRGETDIPLERTMRHVNAELAPELTTLFFLPPRELAEISSSFVRGLLDLEGWETAVSRFVPPPVLEALRQRPPTG